MNKKIGNMTTVELLLLIFSVVFLVLAFSGLVVSVVRAGGETTLFVRAYRDDIVLEMYPEPTSNHVSYYVSGDPVEHQTTIEWYGNQAAGYVAQLQNTVSWTAFKLDNVDYITEVDGSHWMDDPNDETGWLVRQEVNPTIEVSGTNSQLELTLHEGWGTENIVFYSTDTVGEQILDPEWQEWITGKVVWRLTLADVETWTAFKVVATEFTPEVIVTYVESNCWQNVGGGWVEKTPDCPTLDNQTFLPIIIN